MSRALPDETHVRALLDNRTPPRQAVADAVQAALDARAYCRLVAEEGNADERQQARDVLADLESRR